MKYNCVLIYTITLKLVFTLEIRMKYNRDFECGGKKHLIFIWQINIEYIRTLLLFFVSSLVFYMKNIHEIQHAINANRQYTCFYIEKSV